MISFVKGIVEEISNGLVVIDNNGIGYGINISSMVANKLQLNQEIKLYTYMVVKEDDISLYGFMNKDELKMFNQLLSVNGVGPKGALSLLSSLTPGEFALAVVSEDIKSLSVGQGIGKKTAQRIALELKDKVSNEQLFADTPTLFPIDVSSDNSAKSDAIEGLMALGFSKSEASQAVNTVYTNDTDSSKLISKALRVLS